MFEVNKYTEPLSHNWIGFKCACASYLLFCCCAVLSYICSTIGRSITHIQPEVNILLRSYIEAID